MRSNLFFFKQKTAYEIRPSRVGSEMCIRDRPQGEHEEAEARDGDAGDVDAALGPRLPDVRGDDDAADDHGEDPYRDVDEEDPRPVTVGHEHAAEDGPDGRRRRAERPPEAHRHALLTPR